MCHACQVLCAPGRAWAEGLERARAEMRFALAQSAPWLPRDISRIVMSFARPCSSVLVTYARAYVSCVAFNLSLNWSFHVLIRTCVCNMCRFRTGKCKYYCYVVYVCVYASVCV